MLLATHISDVQKRVEMAKLLLRLGATSAQADMNRCSVLHWCVANDQKDLVKVLLENDEAAAKSVINTMTLTRWTPLNTAFVARHLSQADFPELRSMRILL